MFRTLTPPAAVPRFVLEGDSDILAIQLLFSYQKKGKLLNPALRQISWARLFPFLFVLRCRLARSLAPERTMPPPPPQLQKSTDATQGGTGKTSLVLSIIAKAFHSAPPCLLTRYVSGTPEGSLFLVPSPDPTP